MTGYKGGTNHSAVARSNERALHQERKCNAIDAQHSETYTFEGVREELRRYKMTFDGDMYTIAPSAGQRGWVLKMLKEVGARVIEHQDTIQFFAPVSKTLIALRTRELPKWRPDEILMLPAQSVVKRYTPPPKPATTKREIKMRDMRQYGYFNLNIRAQGLPSVFYFSADGQDKTLEMRDWLITLKPSERRERRESFEKIDYKAIGQAAGENPSRNSQLVANFTTKTMRHGNKTIVRTERIKGK